MVVEISIICATIFILLLPIVTAKANEIRTRTERIEIENDEIYSRIHNSSQAMMQSFSDLGEDEDLMTESPNKPTLH